MKGRTTRILSSLLAALLLAASLASCAETGEPIAGSDTGAGHESSSEAETKDEAAEALEDLGRIDLRQAPFGILYGSGFRDEVCGESGLVDVSERSSAQVINDAVYRRNTLLEEYCKMQLELIPSDEVPLTVRKEASAPTGDFRLVDLRLDEATALATSAELYDLLKMGVEVDHSWWDTGTADFCLEGGVYFMNGSINFFDDNVTYVLIFNKDLQKTYERTVPNPYETVQNKEWTLDYFNTVIQGISTDSTGDGKWDEKDTYGFITTWEYGNTFFLGSDLRYVLNDREAERPELFLSDKSRMEKALNVLSLSRRIYHDAHATFMSPGGLEMQGLTAFKEGRGLFYGEVAQYLSELNREMTGDYGVLPVPKYDKAQEFYRTWTHGCGSTFAATAAIPDSEAETVGRVFNAYAIFSHQQLKPAYYDIMLTTRNVRDPESAAMLDIIFQNRVYDMAMYFFEIGFYELFKESVNANDDRFNSRYTGTARRFDNTMKRIMRKLAH